MKPVNSSRPEAQCAPAVMMVRPAAFASNPLTAASNSFQASGAQAAGAAQVQSVALNEFDRMVAQLIGAGVRVEVVQDTVEPTKPDAIFPNNWFSTHSDGTVVQYPMMAINRRAERRADVVEQLLPAAGYAIAQQVDLSASEARGQYLEGTGSMVLDRMHRVAYACLSPRTDVQVLDEFAQRLHYEVVSFDALDAAGASIYHTNVMMSIGERFAVVCADSIVGADQRTQVCDRLAATGREVILIDHPQMNAFAGNILQLASADGGRCVAMSARAWAAFLPAQRGVLSANSVIVSSPCNTIEDNSGGSVRCMLAELHLPTKV